ncbi:MAG TPA: hypothetical protein VGC99_17160 [Candidatus Tectomicrobia bacterium]
MRTNNGNLAICRKKLADEPAFRVPLPAQPAVFAITVTVRIVA